MMDLPIPNAVLIAGPTASGKSSLALRVAKAVNGVVVNADSMQIYSHLQILSARPMPDEMEGIEHRLYGYVDPSIRYSVGLWLDDAVAAIRDIRSQGRCPVLVGGTGLYFKALLEGLNDMPDVPQEVRDYWAHQQRECESSEALYEALQDKDPAIAATLKPGDSQRIIRALEIWDATGKSLLDWQQESALRQDPAVAQGALKLVLCPPRDIVYQRIEDRFDHMLELGGVEEAVRMAEMGLDPVLPAMKAIGVAYLSQYDSGLISYEEAIRLCKRDSRRYAKRQMTWIRNQMGDWPLFETQDAAYAQFSAQLRQLGCEN
ncbi:MAG: tRNA (adenosine(37)-N6)-dimethylallyltransferase MiaA [Cohaesibacter sp.]|nr:tRNA (adenosine(37)-N6)-dimethylallyltransferase MiaA [Cohaesibacter sp.]